MQWKGRLALVCTFAVFGIATGFVVTLLLVKLLWAWTVPDLFPGAVQTGLVARDISWYTAVKLAIFVAFLSGLGASFRAGRTGQA